MRKPLLYLLIFLLLLAAPTAARYLQYYRLGGAQRAEPPRYEPAAVAAVPTPAASNFVDEPQSGEGVVLLDRAHDNRFNLEEINYLDARLSARGYQLLPYTSGDLAAALRPANAFVVIAPLVDYTQEEVVAVIDFVERGGRLLLVGDPTRYDVVFSETDIFAPPEVETAELPLNSLANPFDITFNNDYLYNTAENEGNFRNIILNGDGIGNGDAGEADGLTGDLEQLVFYGSHSLQVGPTAAALLTGDANTWSSDTDRPGNLPLAALSPVEPMDSGGRVLAVGDLHFLMEPYYTVYDNGRFAAQVADFLADGDERVYTVRDFPHFFGNSVELLFSGAPELGPDAFDEIINLQAAFRMLTKSLALTAEPGNEGDILQLGLYNQAGDVADVLEAAGITLVIDPPIEEEAEAAEATGDEEAADEESEPLAEETAARRIESSFGAVQMSGTALILLDEGDEQQRVIVLAASKEGLENTINRLIDLVPLNADYALADCLLTDKLALCPTGVADEPVEAVLDTSGTPEIAPPGSGGEQPPGEIDAAPQGEIELGESVEGTLAADERHAWSFSDGPATIDIVLQASEEVDAILELYDPDNIQVGSADSTFAGGEEVLAGVEVEAGTYTIVVRDYFNDGGSYELTVREGEPGTGEDEGEAAGPIENIFIFADDDGEPLLDGFTSSEALAALLTDYTVQVWSASGDGPLQEGMLDNYDLLIWDSGDYRDEQGLFDEDTGVIINYLDAGGEVLITGASPSLFGEIELAPLSTLEVAGDDPILLEGLTAGDVIELDQTYETTLTEVFEQAETEEVFLVRGPDEEAAGAAIGLAAVDETLNNQKSIFLFVPFVALPADIQETLLHNMLAWFNE